MSIQQQHTGGRPDRSGEILPTGAALLPVLQILALVCLAIFGLRLLEASALTGVGVAVLCCVLAVVGVVGALWVVRRRLGAGRGRAACSVVVLLLVAGPAQLGTIGFSVPVLVVAAALLVVDIGARASLVGDVFVSALPVLSLALGRSWAQTLSDVLSFMALMSVGTALGVVLSGYDVALAAQRRAIAERDAALEDTRRRMALEKELMLAHERARAAHELHDGLGHRLTQIGMSLEFAGRVRDSDPSAAWNEVAVAERTSREAVGEMRTWVRALSPVRAEGCRGVAGLEAVAASFRGTGLEVRVRDELGPHVLTEAAELLMYRAVQEGLTNALRHSRARSVEILAATSGDGLLVSVANDIPAERRQAVPQALVGQGDGAVAGFGLGGLSERAAELGGAVTAGRVDDSFLLTLVLPPRELVSSIDRRA
ncbi:histidine kinase [Actinomyces israelii]|uniref:histidine kinase n=1 Tax=Actinomyces israelii TaxID=1659 RepID=A0ABT4IBC7_9ACTO|nr:histidine kinase [Actinomyces israelii]MCZ0858510.1 histidine kinase [Actinomyces israelii]